MGSRSEVLSLRRHGEKQASDQQMLGDGEFVQEVISGLDVSEKEPAAFRPADRH